MRFWVKPLLSKGFTLIMHEKGDNMGIYLIISSSLLCTHYFKPFVVKADVSFEVDFMYM